MSKIAQAQNVLSRVAFIVTCRIGGAYFIHAAEGMSPVEDENVSFKNLDGSDGSSLSNTLLTVATARRLPEAPDNPADVISISERLIDMVQAITLCAQ
jgi:hypothetical protein